MSVKLRRNGVYVGGDTITGNLIFNDNVKALFGTGSDASIYYDGSDLYIEPQEVGSGDLILANGGGNVGIGTTGPGNKLEVVGSRINLIGNHIQISPASATGTSWLSVSDRYFLIRNRTVGGEINFGTNISGTEGTRVTILNNGHVGIGTILPATRLDIDDGALTLTEMTAPGAGSATSVRIYVEDNGSGKTRLMAIFGTGAAQQLAIEP